MTVNIALRLCAHAKNTPDKPAVVVCRGPARRGGFSCVSHSFAELEQDSNATARGLVAAGVSRGTKTLVMLKPSLAFFSCFFALFKIGAVPVFIDPGMGGRRLLECVRNLAPEAMVGIPLAHLVRTISPRSFPGFKTAVTVGRRWLWGGHSWEAMRRFAGDPLPLAQTGPDELAAILFTTGSTGPAKGVEYTHAALDRQVVILSEIFSITPEDRDAATFPGFSLFSIALGMTATVPDMNPIRPGRVNPGNILAPIRKFGCTFSFGSPALWERVSTHAKQEGVRLTGLKRVVMAGAPVSAALHRRLLGSILGEGSETFTPYGATEVMPVACIGGREVLAETAVLTEAGRGVCVGRPAPGVRVEIIRIDDGPIPEWSDSLLAAPGEIGEIAVQADHASRHYHNLPQADALAKITDGPLFWHRMGDLGHIDEKGRIWFCGRKAHRVKIAGGDLFSVCCEAVFNRHPEVARSALVGVPGRDGFERPIIVIEARRPLSLAEKRKTSADLLRLGEAHELTASIRDVLFHPAFPTDIRHNAKIRREDLAVWAAKKLNL
ncbi:MAG: fatty acid CoA ligase family protein [Planctomycetes bacterium]|nr:fatty acid CoA ligase family protein [Planctomycetota bacterium]